MIHQQKAMNGRSSLALTAREPPSNEAFMGRLLRLSSCNTQKRTNVQPTSSPGRYTPSRFRVNSWSFIQLLLIGLIAFSFLGGIAIHPSHAAPAGTNFDHIVVIAMENQPYSILTGSSTPFLRSLLAVGSTLPHDNHYSDNVNCSAGCYVELTTGAPNANGLGDGWSCCVGLTSLPDQLTAVGLTWQAYCESGCPRGLDHFPFPGYTSLQSSPNIFQSGSVSTSTFIAAANSANPPNFLWYTPTDSHNMHDNSVQSGDSYLDSFLTGAGTVQSPSTGSLLASNVFTNPTFHTMLFLWWDECGGGVSGCDSNSDAPNVEYGPSAGVKTAYVGTGSYTTFSELATIENNWGLARLGSAGSTAPVTEIFGAQGPNPLSGAFSFSPGGPAVGQTVTFTATASGGNPPYSYVWNINGATKSGNPVTNSFVATGAKPVYVTITDSASHQFTTATQTVNVGTSGGSGGIGSKANPPQITGWGGIRLDEAAVGAGGLNSNTSTEPSCCFTGETATNMQLVLERMQLLGYNAVRVDFDPSCTDNQDAQYMSLYSAANLQRAITIAQHYNFWIIVDYHGYVDQSPLTSVSTNTGPGTLILPGYSSLQECWLGIWSQIVTQFSQSYTKIAWEPLNEPTDLDMPTLSAADQLWVTQTRQLGDTHWIILGNLCSNTCSFADFSQGAPTVTDRANLVMISLHAYIGYPYVSPWTNQEADAYAYQFYQWFLSSQTRTGWPSISTELGADPLCDIATCPNAGWGTCSSPATTCSGSAGYTGVSFEFVKYLTNLLNTNNPPIGWLGWTAGSWTDTPGTPLFGALDPADWGTMLGTITITNGGGGSGGGTSFLNLLFSSPIALALGIGVVGIVGAALVLGGRRKTGSHPVR